MITVKKVSREKKYIAILSVLFIICSVFIPLPSSAMSAQQQNIYDKAIPYFNHSTDDACKTNPSNALSELIGKNNEEKSWNFLISKGLTAEQAAGVMGNLAIESGFDTNITNKVSGAYGIAQWLGTRKTALENGAKEAGVEVTSLSYQLDFLYQESNGRKVTSTVASQGYGKAGDNEWETLKKQKTITDATVFWHNNFEVSKQTAEQVLAQRGGSANKIYKKYSSSTPSTPSPSSDSEDTTSAGNNTKQTVVFLDPGHGPSKSTTDKATGLKMDETNNQPEGKQMFEAANQIKTKLEKDGYKVYLSKDTEQANVTFRERADKAAEVKADIAVSIHSSPKTGSGFTNTIYYQKVGLQRTSRNTGKSTKFTNKTTADTSKKYADIMAATRTEAQGFKVSSSIWDAYAAKEPGDIPMVMLFSPTVPWVYNETERDDGKDGTPLTKDELSKYVAGIYNGIKKAVPSTGVTSGDDECVDSGDNFAGGDFAETVKAYAWPDYHKAVYLKIKPEYEAAVKKAQSQGRYVGGVTPAGDHPGVDCGGFVTTLMIDSGFEPNYNSKGKGGNTVSQEKWLKDNWQLLGGGPSIDVKKLQPGDVAINSTHTFVYVGKIDGFNSTTASASVSFSGAGWRTPMAGSEKMTNSGYRVYRKK